jgi:exosome complex component RRP4
MSRGHRPGPRSRGPEAGPADAERERTLVLPGQEIPGRGLKPGPGTYRVGGRIYASVLGLLNVREGTAEVVALSGRYVPKPGDLVVGTVTDAQTTFWLLDIGAPRWAPLHMTGTPWKVDIGDTERYLRIGDSVLVRVESLEATGRIGVTMLGEGLGKLEGGTIVRITPARVPRVVGRKGSMIDTISRMTGAQVSIGQNGRVWVGGSPEAIHRVSEVLQMIEEHGQRSGLTSHVEEYLRRTSDDEPRFPAPRDGGVHDPADRAPEAVAPFLAPNDEADSTTNDEETEPL